MGESAELFGGLGLNESVTFEFVVDGLFGDAELSCGLGFVSPAGVEGLEEGFSFELFEGDASESVEDGISLSCVVDLGREVGDFDAVAGAEDGDSFEDVLELADVAGPVEGAEFLHCGGGDINGGTVAFPADAAEAVLGEFRDGFDAFAEGWDFDGEHAEAVVEVFAELAGADFFFEIDV